VEWPETDSGKPQPKASWWPPAPPACPAQATFHPFEHVTPGVAWSTRIGHRERSAGARILR